MTPHNNQPKNFNCAWPPGPTPPHLEADQVHLWCAHYSRLAPHLHQLGKYLSTDEHARAKRYIFPHLRQEFTVQRGLLRLLLSWYVGLPPAELRFQYSPHNKPALSLPVGAPAVAFNLSHSGDIILYAIAQQALGVDIETVRPIEAIALARRFFAPAEYARLQALPPSEQLPAFFQCWVRKEAYLKATGLGLSFPTDRFEVSLGPDEPAHLLAINGSRSAAQNWTLAEMRPAANYVGALAIPGKGWQINRWRVAL